MTEKQKLRAYLKDNFCFSTLKKAGFFKKDIKSTDYEAQAARICTFFGYESIYEYSANEPREMVETPGVVSGKFPDAVDKDGNLKPGGGFHMSVAGGVFECPVCTCEQHTSQHSAFGKNDWGEDRTKCKGCKRKLLIRSSPMTGRLLGVDEINTPPLAT